MQSRVKSHDPEPTMPITDWLLPEYDAEMAATRRTPGHVLGDGRHTVADLIELVNQDPRRGVGHRLLPCRRRSSGPHVEATGLVGRRRGSGPPRDRVGGERVVNLHLRISRLPVAHGRAGRADRRHPVGPIAR